MELPFRTTLLLALVGFLGAADIVAQGPSVSLIPAPTVPMNVMDADLLPSAGATVDLPMINAAVTPGSANLGLTGMTITPTSGYIFYNSQCAPNERAFALDYFNPGVLYTVENPGSTYETFDVEFHLPQPSQEFGIAVGKTVSTASAVKLEFFLGGVLQDSIFPGLPSVGWSSCQGGMQYFRLDNALFDSVKFSGGKQCILGLSIESAPATLTLAASNLIAGSQASLDVTNATPGGIVAYAYSLHGPGPTNVQSLLCPGGLTLSLSTPLVRLGSVTADPAGNASFSAPVPPTAPFVQVHIQALDFSTCELSNLVTQFIQ